MNRINIYCHQCGKIHDVARTKEIAGKVESLNCNWCPDCEANEDYFEWHNLKEETTFTQEITFEDMTLNPDGK